MTTLLENLHANMWMITSVLFFVSLRLYPLSLRNLTTAKARYSHLKESTSALAMDRQYLYVRAWIMLVGNIALTIMSLQITISSF